VDGILTTNVPLVVVIRCICPTVCLIVADARDVRQRTALHYAAVVGNVDVVVILLNSGANALVQDVSGLTPLHLSVSITSIYSVYTIQWSNYEGARGGLAPLKDRAAPSKHLV